MSDSHLPERGLFVYQPMYTMNIKKEHLWNNPDIFNIGLVYIQFSCATGVYRPNELISLKAISLITKDLRAIFLILCTIQFIVQ